MYLQLDTNTCLFPIVSEIVECVYGLAHIYKTNCNMRDLQQNYTKNVIIFVARDSTMIVLFPSLTRSITNLLVVMYACDSVTAIKRNSSENLKMMKYEKQKHLYFHMGKDEFANLIS